MILRKVLDKIEGRENKARLLRCSSIWRCQRKRDDLMLQATRLRCEYLQNPLGIGERNPSFGYLVESDKHSVLQTAYRLQVSERPDFEIPLWDTGEVASDESVHILYEGPALRSFTVYFYRVQITDNQNENSMWSEAASFETANLGDYAWTARFITPPNDSAEGSKGFLLRKEFAAEAGLVSARVYATALGMYELSVNGKPAADWLFAPGWTEYGSRLAYQTYDITSMLKEGQNTVGASLGCGWYKGDLASWAGDRNRYGKRNAFFAEIMLCYADGRREVIGTDTSWRVLDGPIVFSELYHGESYDARLEIPGWDEPGSFAWPCAEALETNLAVLVAQDGLPVRRHEVFEPVAMFTTPAGERVIDFGQNMAGFVEFVVSGQAGDKVVLKHAEVLDKDGNFYMENLRSARCTVEYILKGEGEERFSPHFTFQGFRYIQIVEYPGEVKPESFKAVAVYSDMRPVGTFSSDHPLLDRLCDNILWGLKSNFVDIPTDCPQRDERLGWTGDAQVFVMAACYLMEAEPFFKKWLRDVSAAQLPDGGIPHVVPDVLTQRDKNGLPVNDGYGATGWGDAAVICPWTLYLTSGDKKLLAEQYPSMKAWVEFIRGRAQDGLLWNTGFHFGDWVALDAKEGSYLGATPNDLTATAYYAYSTGLLSKTADALGYAEDAEAYRALREDIVKAFQNEFFTPSGRLAARTQTAHILALMFDLCQEKDRRRTVDTLSALIKENDDHLVTGFLGTPYFCHVLSQNGKLAEAYALLLREEYPSWLYQVKAGATTVWEHWDGIKPDGSMWSKDMNSFNHYAYGSIGDWLFGVAGGLKPDENSPGYKHILISPQPGGGINRAKTDYDSLYGRITVSWERKDGKTTLFAVIPPNTTALVCLPDAEAGEYGGIRFEAGEGGAQAEIGSGAYTWQW